MGLFSSNIVYLAQKPFCTVSLVTDLFIEMLNSMKKNNKSRQRWLKYMMRKEKKKVDQALVR